MKIVRLFIVCLLYFTFLHFGNGSIADVNEILSIVQWNSDAKSQTLNGDVLSKLTDALPPWKIKQMTWPSIGEVNVSCVAASQEVKISCVNWLKKFVTDDYLPGDLMKNLIAMKGWGLIREEHEQKRLCDVFISK